MMNRVTVYLLVSFLIVISILGIINAYRDERKHGDIIYNDETQMFDVKTDPTIQFGVEYTRINEILEDDLWS